MTSERLLIIDDEKDMLEGIKRLLGYELTNLQVETCADPRQGIELARQLAPDAVLLDVRMPGMDGIEVMGALKRHDPLMTCIIMTAHGTIELAVDAMRAGAYDFITKPFETETLLRVLDKGLERNRLIRENQALRGKVEKTDFHGMIGRSPVMRQLFDKIMAVARSDYSVLIRGESGTGKELTARAVHAESRRSRRDLVVVNCPAIPEHLLESELFGHRRGAFTGAERDQRGLFEEADGGTLFLDEIADIPVSVQTKLLRALQEGEIKPLGSVKSISVDVRIIAATNQNLEEKIRDRTFREDLFYRLGVVNLKTPNLEETAVDIPLLANHFAKIASEELEIPHRQFSPEALQLLTGAGWPGNVRQLQNVVRQAVMFSTHEIISKDRLSGFLTDVEKLSSRGSSSEIVLETEDGGSIESYRDAKERVIERFTRRYIRNPMERTGGNVTKSAEISGLGRPSLQKILRRLGIDAGVYRED